MGWCFSGVWYPDAYYVIAWNQSFFVNHCTIYELHSLLGVLFTFASILDQIDCNKEKRIIIINWVSKTQFKLSFLTLFTGGKKCLEKPLENILQSLKINTSILKVCFNYTSEFEDKYMFRKSTSSILLSFKINTLILKASFKYTSKFEKKYINLENLLPVYFWVWT